MSTVANTPPKHVGIFERIANFLLSRLPWFRYHYEGWGKARKIIIAFFLYLIVLPIIPIIIALVLYIRDPEGFRKSKAFPALAAIIVVWLGAFGYIASRPATTSSSSDTATTESVADTTTSSQTNNTVSTHKNGGSTTAATGKPTNGRYFKNCDAAFKVGVRNIPRGDKSYRPRLDHDNDGVACEK